MTNVIATLRSLAGEAPLPLRVAGACMEPSLADGAHVVIQARPCYWPGDIVAFADARGRIVLHRVIGYRRGLALLTQSDQAGLPDSTVPWSRVLGRVATATPWRARLFALARFCRFARARLAARLP